MTNVTDIALPRLYDMNMNYIDRIQPTKVGYELKRNKVSTATLDMDGADQLPTVPQICQFVDLFETWGSIGKFRVESLDIECSAGEDRTFYLEHAITTLSDGCIDGYLELGGTGVHTRAVLSALLALQPVIYWVLGDCDFDYQFQHSFENDDLLTAIFSVPASFTDEYIWTYNTDVFPFVLNLKHVEDGDASELRMNRNIKSVKISIDREPLCTRIYPKGYGEGTNQLTIADVNNGLRYLDADTQSTYGIVCKQWPDTTFTDAALLKSVATTVLNRLKEPLVTTVFEAYEIFELTGETLDRFYVGRLVRAPLPAFGTTIRERVVSIAKKDVYMRNEDATITLTNKSSDITDDLAELVRKATIGELYSQGATNMYAEHYADNASPEKPLVCKFWIDEACVHINAVILEYTIESFRSYSATSDYSGDSTNTSSTGGGGSRTSSAGGYQNITKPISVYIDSATTGNPLDAFSAGTKAQTDLEADEARTSGTPSRTNTGACADITTESSGSLTTNGGGAVATGDAGGGNTESSDSTSHNHSFSGSDSFSWGHTHSVTAGVTSTGGVKNYSDKNVSISGSTGSSTCSHKHYVYAHSHTGGSHTHNINGHTHIVPAHYHTLNAHTHSIPLHRHGMNHFHMCNIIVRIPELEITVRDHTHTVDIPLHEHSVTIPSHTHNIIHGIYEGGRAASVAIKVDNTVVPAVAMGGSVDLVAYLTKDDNGKITRNTWHRIEITPDALTRIVSDVFVKTFIRSIGGGTY